MKKLLVCFCLFQGMAMPAMAAQRTSIQANAAPVSQKQDDGLERAKARKTGTYTTLADYWEETEASGEAVIVAPETYPVDAQYKTSVTEQERALMERRGKAIVDYLASLPPLRDSNVTITVDPEVNRIMKHFSLYMTIEIERIAIYMNLNSYFIPDETWRVIGSTRGGCKRWQLQKGWAAGAESFSVGHAASTGGKAVGTIHVALSADVFRYLPHDGLIEKTAASPSARLIAALYTMDCDRLMELANLP